MNSIPCDSGCYQLFIKITRQTKISIGALGAIDFPKGFYVYTGRAKKNLKARVKRHCRKNKKIRWHIDYLLEYGQIKFIKYFPGRFDECIINGDVVSKCGDAKIIKGFGSSDCRCRGHLIYVGLQLPDDRTKIS